MQNTRLIAAGAILAITAIGLSVGWTVKHRHKPAPMKPVAAASTVFAGPEVTLTGSLQAQTTEQLEAPIAGVLDAWFVEEGQEVYEDQLVGRIRNPELDAAAQNAQAAVDRAEISIAQLDAQASSALLEASRAAADQVRARNELERIEKIYQRQKSLMDAEAIARLIFEKTESDFNSAKSESANRDASAKDAQDKAAALDRDSEEAKRTVAEKTIVLAKAKAAVAEGDLHSPADGVVLTRNGHQGAQVEASKESLIAIATDLRKLAVSLTPDTAVLARIRAGEHAFVRLSEMEFPGEVHEVRGAEVIVNFTSPTPITKLGTPAQVRIVF
jgi:multidrug efflux pump subunit AcrA (membrane-fusion protein)